ncbi:MAG: hypothetical protein Q9213_004711 [Squamulea squamosa]
MSGIINDENHPPSPPPAPPLPPQKYGNRAASAIARFAQPFIYTSRPPSAHGDRPPLSRELDTRLRVQRSSSPASRTTAHKTGLPINAFDISPSRTHAILAGREILKTIRVTESTCAEDFNLRSSIIAYAAAHDGSGGTISAKHKDLLAATDVKWSHGNYEATIATAATSGQIVIYDINRAGVELARLHEHSRQVHRIAFNPFQGALLLSGSQDSTVRLWDLRALAREGSVLTCRSTHKYPGNSEGVRDLRWSPTEGMEFAVGTDNGVVQRWDFQRPNVPLLKLNAHEKTCYSIDWHPDGKHLASGGADKIVKVWDFSSTDRRMKPCWQLRTPKAVHNLRWRPPHWRAEEGSPGHWDSTQLATSYDNQDPRTHIWDLRRPTVPAQEIDRYETAPTAILWHSESLLWSVGIAGMFTQTDINFAKKVSDKQTSNAMTTAPDGSLALFLEDRSRRKAATGKSGHEYDQRRGRAGSTSDKLSSSFSAAEGSFEEPSLLSSSFKSRRRKAPSTRSSRSLANTPPSTGNGGPVRQLNEALHREDRYRSAQKAACGNVRGVFDADAFIFLACRYKNHVSLYTGPNKPVIDSLSEALLENAVSAAYVGQYRLAQSWRILALALRKELPARAERNRARRSQQSKRMSKEEDFAHSNGSTWDTRGDRYSANGSRPGPAIAPTKIPTNIPLDGGSNMTTPLVRPVPSRTVKTTSSSDTDESNGYDSLELPEPRFRKRSPQKPIEKPSALSRLRSPNDNDASSILDGNLGNARSSQEIGSPARSGDIPPRGGQGGFHDIDRHMNERRAAIQNFRTTPRPVLRLEDSVQLMENDALVPRFDRHDSNESFQMFSASTDSSHRARSLIGSFTSSQDSGSSGLVPERWDVGQRLSNVPDPGGTATPDEPQGSAPSHKVLRAPKEISLIGASPTTQERTLERPTSTTRILHEEDTFTSDQEPDGYSVHTMKLEEHRFIESDFHPSAFDPPPDIWTATAMLGPLIDYHLQHLSDVQLPAHILLLLGPYIEHDIPSALVSSIFLDYHSQLTSLSLYTQAAHLRKIAFSRIPEIIDYGTYGIDSGGPWCTNCKKSSKGDRDGFCSRCKQYWAPCSICDGIGAESLLPEHAMEDAAAITDGANLSGGCDWGWCQDCGHGGHVGCLRAWWDNVDASEGGCPTLGCLHDCVAGYRRAAVLQRKADTKKASTVKGDAWIVGESLAVEKTRGLMGKSGQDNFVVQDSKITKPSTPVRGPLSMTAMGRTSSGGKKVRLIVPDAETEIHDPKVGRGEERTKRRRYNLSAILTITNPLIMENEKGELVDLYVPRKCSATNRIIKAKDHASVQISVGKVDENGRYTGENQVYALCGFVRAMGEGDDSLNRLAQRDGLLKGVWSGKKEM